MSGKDSSKEQVKLDVLGQYYSVSIIMTFSAYDKKIASFLDNVASSVLHCDSETFIYL